jgi:lipopolysaccharide export system protein LptA
MKRSEAARYARWSAILAFLIAGATGGIYLRRVWISHVEKQHAPPPPPKDVERQSSGLTFSKGEGTKKTFTVHASKSTDFKGEDASLLEEVTVTVFGNTGERNDIIRSNSCRYSKTDGAIQCSGTVTMDLQSATDFEKAEKNPTGIPNVVRVETSGVTFEPSKNEAQTVAPVKFAFPNGHGTGVGAVYSSEVGHLRLIRDVHLKLHPSAEVPGVARKANPTTAPPDTEVDVTGASMDMDRNTHMVLLHGPTISTTATQQLTAGELTLYLDEEFHAQTLVATPGAISEEPKLVGHGAKGQSALTANKLTATFAVEGWVRSAKAEGDVHGTSETGSLQAETAEAEMWPKVNQIKQINVRGNVNAISREPKTGMQRHLTTNALQMDYSGGAANQASKIKHAETLERGALEWNDTATSRSKVAGDKLTVDFGEQGKAQQLFAKGAVQTERQLPGRPLQTATAADGVAQLDPAGAWTQITLHKNVHLKEGDRSADSQQAVFTKADQTAVLTGQAYARDASSETRATKIIFHQDSGDIDAEGNVRSTDFSSKSSAVQLSPAPANISSEHMQGNSKTGRALYTGHARLWQGASVLQSDSIELLRETRVLNAVGNVRAVFLQAPQANPNGTASPAPVIAKAPTSTASTSTLGQPTLWHISSATLTYWDNDNKAHLEKNVFVQSPEEKIHSNALDLFFTRQQVPGQAGPGPSEISRAVALGNVVVDQGDRRGTADRGVYTADDQKFVLSGGTPTLYDTTEGTTTGRELTFNMADDTIIVDSGSGSRTLTKHRVQK